MFLDFFKRFTGAHYRKYLRRAQPIVQRINQFEQQYQSLSADQLRAKTEEFRGRYQQAMEGFYARRKVDPASAEAAAARLAALDALAPEAFAAVKNAARRLCGTELLVCGQPLRWEMVHYDVQLIGGLALHENRIAEMATGEGKTLVATCPLYLNALAGRGSQLVTVNDYLARRDSEWMGYLYKALGLTVGCIQNSMAPEERRAAYACDITYGTAAEFGFDYLRDNGMAVSQDQQVQRDFYFCIIDEVDSILIDEARTPLIISGPAQNTREAPFLDYKPLIERLTRQQTALCNRLISEAKTELDKPAGKDRDEKGALEKMYQVKLGSPRNKQFLRLLEDGQMRRTWEKFDLEMHADYNKDKVYALKEELFYVLEERQHTADLTEKGRNFLQPDDPNAYVMPDLPTIYSALDGRRDLAPEEKARARADAQAAYEQVTERIHCISQLLRAYTLYERDIQYVVQQVNEGEPPKVQIVDENTGRVMPGRRWSDGLHQAIEAKEGVPLERETKTYATITIQNYFRLYEKLAGMTGTAETEAGEFKDIYKLTVMVIPTHRPNKRTDLNDIIYKTRREKYNAVVAAIKEAHGKGQPVLVGTASVESSEVVSRLLRRESVPHTVLNAKYHQQEAEIVARAGQRGAVTISTNMAGRGTDIKLGPGVPELGGLYVLGTERHQSRRVDRQLRGRCARQGDPGLSRFFLSLEDDLMRLYQRGGFAATLLNKAIVEGEPLEDPLLNPAIQQAQKNVEQLHYSTRKRLLSYDDVLNQQREVVYGLRNQAIHAEGPREILLELMEEEIDTRVDGSGASDKREPDEAAREELLVWANQTFPIALKAEDLAHKDGPALTAFFKAQVREAYQTKIEPEPPEAIARLERMIIIQAIDRHWQDHLTAMEELRQSVGLRSYGQKDPLVEYKTDAFRYFNEMMGAARQDVCRGAFRNFASQEALQSMLVRLGRVQMVGPNGEAVPAPAGAPRPAGNQTRPPVLPRPPAGRLPVPAGAPAAGASAADGAAAPAPAPRKEIVLPKVQLPPEPKPALPVVGRNDLCPCGSGKKYKKCCGAHE